MKKNWKEYLKACREYDSLVDETKRELNAFYNEHVYKGNEGKTVMYALGFIFVMMTGVGIVLSLPIVIENVSEKLETKRIQKEQKKEEPKK